jgi:hypothetical protein
VTSFGEVPLKRVWQLLDTCAPGHTHNYCVRFRDKSFPTLPLGRHGKRESPPIQIGHIRQIVRQLGIDRDCARRVIPQLG